MAQIGPLAGLDKFLNALLNGVALGAVYALLALGFVIIFKATQVINFAHGSLAAIGAFLTASFFTILNFPGRFLPETADLGPLVAVGAVRGDRGRSGGTAGREDLHQTDGRRTPLLSGDHHGRGRHHPSDHQRRLRRSRRPVAAGPVGNPVHQGWQHQYQSDPDRHGGGLAACASCSLPGSFAAASVWRCERLPSIRKRPRPRESTSDGSLLWPGPSAPPWRRWPGSSRRLSPRAAGITSATAFVVFRAFPAIIIGGLDSVVGAVVGGFLVGIAEIVIGTYTTGISNIVGVGFGTIVPYLLMLVFLLFRPYGLFGTEKSEEYEQRRGRTWYVRSSDRRTTHHPPPRRQRGA